MIDAKKLGEIFRKKDEVTIQELIQEIDGCGELPYILQRLMEAGILIQYEKEGMPYGLTLFGKHLMGVK